MVLEPGADDFLAVEKIFRADEADHAVDQQRIERTGDAVSARFEGLLIDTVMGARRQRRALPGLEIHDIVADGRPPQRQPGFAGFLEHRKIDPKTSVGSLSAGNRLEYQIDGETP